MKTRELEIYVRKYKEKISKGIEIFSNLYGRR